MTPDDELKARAEKSAAQWGNDNPMSERDARGLTSWGVYAIGYEAGALSERALMSEQIKAWDDQAGELKKENAKLRAENASLQAQLDNLTTVKMYRANEELREENARLQIDCDTVKAEMHRYRNMWLKLRERVEMLESALKSVPIDAVRCEDAIGIHYFITDWAMGKIRAALDAVKEGK